MRFLLCLLGFLAIFSQVHAGQWVNLGTMSTTVPNHMCSIVETNSGSNTYNDIYCPATNPEIIAGGAISASGISTTSLFVTGQPVPALAPEKGRVIVGNGSAWVDLGVGADDQVLTADSALSAGVKWADAAGGSGTTGDMDGFFASKSTDTTLSTSWGDVTGWDAASETSAPFSWNASTGELTINTAGLYLIGYSIGVDNLENGRSEAGVRLSRDTGSGYAPVAVSERYIYSRSTDQGKGEGTFNWVVSLAAGEKLKLQALRDFAEVKLVGNQQAFFGVALTGAIGPQGPAGDIEGISSSVKGNLAVSNGTEWVGIGAGSDGQVLTADSSEPTGVKWADAASGGSGISKYTTAERNNLTPTQGDVIYNLTEDRIEWFDGSSWITFSNTEELAGFVLLDFESGDLSSSAILSSNNAIVQTTNVYEGTYAVEFDYDDANNSTLMTIDHNGSDDSLGGTLEYHCNGADGNGIVELRTNPGNNYLSPGCGDSSWELQTVSIPPGEESILFYAINWISYIDNIRFIPD